MGKLLYFLNGKLVQPRVSKKTIDLLSETRKNKGGQTYNLFDCQNDRNGVLQYIADSLDKFRVELKKLAQTGSKGAVDEHFEATLASISAIRIDETDRNQYPMKLIFDEFTKGGIIPFQDKKKDGVTRSVLEDGIMLLLPELGEEYSDNKINNTQNKNARHTLIHEILHAMSNYKKVRNGKEEYVAGMQIYGSDNIFDDLNEGLNEYYTRMIMKKMYPNEQIEERYSARVNVIEAFMGMLDKDDQDKIFEAYVTGNFEQVLDSYFTEMKTATGETFIERLEKLRGKGFRVTSSDGATNMQCSKLIVDGLKDFSKTPEKQHTA